MEIIILIVPELAFLERVINCSERSSTIIQTAVNQKYKDQHATGSAKKQKEIILKMGIVLYLQGRDFLDKIEVQHGRDWDRCEY